MAPSLSPYLQRVAANILHLSQDQEDVVKALKEWEYQACSDEGEAQPALAKEVSNNLRT